MSEKSTHYAALGLGLGLIFGIVAMGGVKGRSKIYLFMAADMTHPLSNLKTGATYFWKVRADDGKGGISESETRSFSTS